LDSVSASSASHEDFTSSNSITSTSDLPDKVEVKTEVKEDTESDHHDNNSSNTGTIFPCALPSVGVKIEVNKEETDTGGHDNTSSESSTNVSSERLVVKTEVKEEPDVEDFDNTFITSTAVGHKMEEDESELLPEVKFEVNFKEGPSQDWVTNQENTLGERIVPSTGLGLGALGLGK
jgi:hypothetical protein